MSREEVIARLAQIRDIARLTSGEFRFTALINAALPSLHLIEEAIPEHESWSRGLTEAELTPETRLGEHLAVTRIMLGLPS